MQISGLQKTTVLDYPEHLAAIIFTRGCNYRCPFCHNSELLQDDYPILLESDVLDYLENRRNILDGVTISGGEPTIQSDLEDFIRKLKSLGYDVKLDTNGTNPQLIKKLIDEGLIDYIAMDIKSDFNNYEKITGVSKVNIDKIKESIEIIKNSPIKKEFRTTIVKEFHDPNVIKNICALIGNSNYYLQNFEDSGRVLRSGLHGFTKKELEDFEKKLKKDYPNLHVRGI